MITLLALICPPIAYVCIGRPGGAILALLCCLTIYLWPLASLFAVCAVINFYNRREDRGGYQAVSIRTSNHY